MAEAVLQRLRELGDQYNLRDPRKLFQIAERQGVAGASQALAKEALAPDVGRQVLAPPPSYRQGGGHEARQHPAG